MATIKVKRLWQLASTLPRDQVFVKATVLIEAAKEYFEWCDNNPRYQTQIVKHKLQWDTIDVELKRPYTMSGLCMYLGVANSYFRTMKAELAERYEAGRISEDELQVYAAMEWIEQIVFTDQIEGAATGQYSAVIMTRLNGLADNVNNTNMPDPILRIVTRDPETTANLNLLTAAL